MQHTYLNPEFTETLEKCGKTPYSSISEMEGFRVTSKESNLRLKSPWIPPRLLQTDWQDPG